MCGARAAHGAPSFARDACAGTGGDGPAPGAVATVSRAGWSALRRLAVGVVGALLLSACDPGTKSSSDVALVRLEDGRLILIGNVCSFPLEKIELGTDGSPAMSTITPGDTTTGWFSVDLDHPTDGFQLAPGSAPVEKIDLPLQVAVRLRSDGGVWAWQQFDSLPKAGEGLTRDPSSGKVVSSPLDCLPTTVESCPEVTRPPFPAVRSTPGGSATDQ